jgi:hypothetical protein
MMFLVKGGEVGGLNVFPPGRKRRTCDLCGVGGIVFYGRAIIAVTECCRGSLALENAGLGLWTALIAAAFLRPMRGASDQPVILAATYHAMFL